MPATNFFFGKFTNVFYVEWEVIMCTPSQYYCMYDALGA